MGPGVVITLMAGVILNLSSNVSFSAPRRFTPVDRLHHIHGLAVDPHDPAILYVATHGGLVPSKGTYLNPEHLDKSMTLDGILHSSRGSTHVARGRGSEVEASKARKYMETGINKEKRLDRHRTVEAPMR